MLGGNVEFLANEEMKKLGIDPVEQPEEYEKAWDEALARAEEAVKAEHDEVVALGGLYVLGTERHESRRIDNQLRGRSGRQGDPGESRFYLSLEDDLMRLFSTGAAAALMNRAGFPEDVPLEAKMVTRGIQNAQGQVEARNHEIRKNVLKYDDVMSRQREVIYAERRRVLDGEDMADQIQHFVRDVLTAYVNAATAEGTPDQWDLEALWTALRAVYPVSITTEEVVEQAGGAQHLSRELLLREVLSDAEHAYAEREATIGEENMRMLERRVVLSVLDRKWREHLYEMDYLKEGIGLRAMAQRDPLVEYQREGFQLFQAMTEAIKEESVGFLFNLEVTVTTEGDEDADEVEVEIEIEGEDDFSDEVDVPVTPPSQRKKGGRKAPDTPAASGAGSALGVAASGGRLVAKGLDDGPRRQVPLQYSAPSVDGDAPSIEDGEVATVTSGTPPVTAAHKDGQTFPGTPRNAECPCGSGKKYKVCHGRNE